jgi:hypothetical protein
MAAPDGKRFHLKKSHPVHEKPARPDRFDKLKGAHASHEAHAPAPAAFAKRLNARGLGKGKPTE